MSAMAAPIAVSAALSLLLTGCELFDNRGTTTPPPATPAPVEGCPRLMKGIMCVGGDLETHTVDSLADCCELCSSSSGCAAFTHQAGTGSCVLKSTCQSLAQDWTNGLNTTSGTMPGRLNVQRGWMEVDGYKCSDQKDTVLFFPDANGSYPVIVYGHGTWGAIDGMDAWLELIASEGFIVVAPFSGKLETPCGSNSAHDMVNVMEKSKLHGASLHPALGMANWKRTGVFGHSRGGHYVPLAASLMQSSKMKLNVKAMVVSHAAPWKDPMKTPEPRIPAMFTSGTLDNHDDDDHVYNFYSKYPALNRVYAKLTGGTHMEPQTPGKLNKFTAAFFSCHVQQQKEACSLVYGKGPEDLCQAYSYEKCHAHMNGPMLGDFIGEDARAVSV